MKNIYIPTFCRILYIDVKVYEVLMKTCNNSIISLQVRKKNTAEHKAQRHETQSLFFTSREKFLRWEVTPFKYYRFNYWSVNTFKKVRYLLVTHDKLAMKEFKSSKNGGDKG